MTTDTLPEAALAPYASAETILAALHDGRLSARTLMERTYDRIAAINPGLNAIISLRPRAEMLAEAEAADRALALDRAAGRRPAALAGLPIAVKDLALTKGLRTTFGSPIFADFIPGEDTLMVARLRAAGALILGKTNTPVFGLGSHTTNALHGPTQNSFLPGRSAGGSSGGAAVAVAAGLLPVADGSDYGGSLRNPAAWNNIFGLRPTQGRIPSVPSGDVFFGQMATDGPMAATIADLALLLDVQSGPDPRAPLSRPPLPVRPALEDGPLRGLRVGWLGDLDGHLPTEAGILETCATALDGARARGDIALADAALGFEPEALWQAFVALRHFSVAPAITPLWEDPQKKPLLNAQQVWEYEGFLGLSGPQVSQAAAVRSAFFQRILALFEDFDLLALPATQLHPFPVDWAWPQQIAGREMDSYHRWMEVVVAGTMAGCPVLAAPAGFSGDAPVGLQFIARPDAEAQLLRFGLAWEAGLERPTGNRAGFAAQL
ncbi:amidase [Pseudooceanicola sp. CBS1P-1]|uniref:Amidase n=1 Tax=Pseudooceanicola albus TaxID=2692189 RepID=A0A6L7FZS3_9RHOB|nr:MULTISPECIES: amidase [Pseudooceanicola]MBT9383750.1 amidase [Pseudooceanicola endophyticus]MXN17604.1 amidase [Pseudooceanicola albus]